MNEHLAKGNDHQVTSIMNFIEKKRVIKDLKTFSNLPLLETGVVCVGNWDFAIQRFQLIIKHSMEQTYESNKIITFNFVENATKNSKIFGDFLV